MQPIILAFALLGGPPPDLSVMQFREIDGNTQHLYVATCFRSSAGGSCSLNVVSVSTDKSPRKCVVSVQTLFENESAQNPQAETFAVTASSGACGYSSTYVMSPRGMVHTKTSPPSVPAGLEGVCNVTHQRRRDDGAA